MLPSLALPMSGSTSRGGRAPSQPAAARASVARYRVRPRLRSCKLPVMFRRAACTPPRPEAHYTLAWAARADRVWPIGRGGCLPGPYLGGRQLRFLCACLRFDRFQRWREHLWGACRVGRGRGDTFEERLVIGSYCFLVQGEKRCIGFGATACLPVIKRCEEAASSYFNTSPVCENLSKFALSRSFFPAVRVSDLSTTLVDRPQRALYQPVGRSAPAFRRKKDRLSAFLASFARIGGVYKVATASHADATSTAAMASKRLADPAGYKTIEMLSKMQIFQLWSGGFLLSGW